MILKGITETTDPLVRKEQTGFRKGMSCADHVFTLRQSQSRVMNSTLYIIFIDFTKTFDSVNKLALERILSHNGIPDELISIINMQYTNLNARVTCGTNLTDAFKLKK